MTWWAWNQLEGITEISEQSAVVSSCASQISVTSPWGQTRHSGSPVKVDLPLDMGGQFWLSSQIDHYFSTEFLPSYTKHFLSTKTLISSDMSTPLVRVQPRLLWTRKIFCLVKAVSPNTGFILYMVLLLFNFILLKILHYLLVKIQLDS